MRDVYNYFSNSSKRQEQFKVVQHFCNMEPHKLLRPCQTRWLSLHSCVSRLIEQWDAPILFFQAVAGHDKLLISGKILSLLQNPIWKLYFHFPKFTALNVMFQSSKSSVHCLYNGLSATYRELLSCYLLEAYWKGVPLKDINPASQVNFLPLPKMYMGAKVCLCLMKEEYKQRPTDVQHFLSARILHRSCFSDKVSFPNRRPYHRDASSVRSSREPCEVSFTCSSCCNFP